MDLMDYRRKIIASSPHLSHAEGAVATFPDGADLPLKSLIVDIDPVQSGSGDPSPTNIRPISGWNGVNVTRTGKNLLAFTGVSSTGQGITWTANSNGTYTVNGSSTAFAGKKCGVVNLRKGVTYRVSGSIRDKINAYLYKSGLGIIGGTDTGSGVVYTPTESIDNVDFYVSVPTGRTIDNLTCYPMISVGADTVDWEPYTADTYSITFPTSSGTVYGGTLDPLTGVLTVDRQFFELDGNSNVTKGSSGSASASEAFPYWATIYIPCNNATTNYSAWRFSHGKCQSSAYSGIFRTFKTNNTTIQATVGTDALISTTADAKTWLQTQKDNGTPLQIVAELTTPLTYQLSPQTFRSLAGQNNIFADTGNVALDYWAHP